MNNLRNGSRAKPARLVDATFPRSMHHVAWKRDAWHRMAREALQAATGKPLTFVQLDALRDAARFEAIALLAEHRRRTKDISAAEFERLDSTLANAIAAKARILAKLGLQGDSDPASPAGDPWKDLDAIDPSAGRPSP